VIIGDGWYSWVVGKLALVQGLIGGLSGKGVICGGMFVGFVWRGGCGRPFSVPGIWLQLHSLVGSTGGLTGGLCGIRLGMGVLLAGQDRDWSAGSRSMPQGLIQGSPGASFKGCTEDLNRPPVISSIFDDDRLILWAGG